MPANGLVGRVALAKLAGVHPDRVSVWTGQGMPVVTRGGAGVESAYDPVACLAWICQRRAIGNAKERYYEELAEREKRANALRAGDVCERFDVLSATHALIARARDALLGLPSKIKTAEPSVSVSVCVTIDRLVREMLDELADGMNGVTPPGESTAGERHLPTAAPTNGRPARRVRKAGP